jgi:hypothetical protein
LQVPKAVETVNFQGTKNYDNQKTQKQIYQGQARVDKTRRFVG